MKLVELKVHDKYLPHMMGHEGYAEVVKIGKSLKKSVRR